METETLQVHQTKKKKKIVMLPAIRKFIYQPNRVTNAFYDYSLVQERLFNAVMFYLQDAITVSRKGEDYTQLSLFQEYKETSYIKIRIPLKEIAIPQNYEHVKKSVKQLASIVVEIPYLDKETKEKRIRYAGLFNADVPDEKTRSSYIDIEIDKRVAKMLIEIDQNQFQQPINYTRFIYQIAQNATNKYTSRIYKLICSWRKKGGFTISLDEFREQLGIELKYKYFNDIKKHILKPVQDELFEKADCWFNINSEDFITKQGNTVTHLNFKVITPELIEEDSKRRDYALNLLRTHFKFQDTHIDKIKVIFNNASMADILFKITQLREYYMENVSKINDITGYVITALLNKFGNPETK
jgi:plasmid replication initiation protein